MESRWGWIGEWKSNERGDAEMEGVLPVKIVRRCSEGAGNRVGMVCRLKETGCEEGEADRPEEVERRQSPWIEGKIETVPGWRVRGDGKWGNGVGR